VNKKKLFFISIHKKSKGYYEIIPKRHLTIGNCHDCDILDSIAGLPERHQLLKKSGGRYYLRIPSGVDGIITNENKSLSLKDVIAFDLLKKEGDCYLFPLPKKSECGLTIGEHTITFGYRDRAIPERKPEKIDSSLKKSFIGRENYSFLSILSLSLIIHFSAVGYLNSLEIKKEEPIDAINKIPHRFAKLILQPPQKKILKTVVNKLPIEKKEEKGTDKKEEETKKKDEKEVKPLEEIKEGETVEKVKEKIQNQENYEKEVAMLNPPEKLTANREAVREKVKTKGLLGVIMAKATPDEISSDAVFRDVDKLVKGIEKERGDKETEDLLKIGSGKIDDLSKKITENSFKIKYRDTNEIIAEKKEILKEDLNRNKENLSPDARKRNEAEVYKTVSTYVGGLKYLYNNELRKNPLLKGKVTVKIVISQDGKVVKSEVVSSTLGSPELEEAIINRIYRWRFPELNGVDDFTIDYTFDFAPVG